MNKNILGEAHTKVKKRGIPDHVLISSHAHMLDDAQSTVIELIGQLPHYDQKDIAWLAQYPEFRYCVIGKGKKYPTYDDWQNKPYTLAEAVELWVTDPSLQGLGILPTYGDLLVIDIDELGMTEANKRLAHYTLDDDTFFTSPMTYHTDKPYVRADKKVVGDMRAKMLIRLADPSQQPFKRKQQGVELMFTPTSQAVVCGAYHPDSGVRYSIRVKAAIPTLTTSEYVRLVECLVDKPKLATPKSEVIMTRRTYSDIELPKQLVPPSDFFIQHDHHVVERIASDVSIIDLAVELGYEVVEDVSSKSTHRVLGQGGLLIDQRKNVFDIMSAELDDGRIFGGGPIQFAQYALHDLADETWRCNRELFNSLIWWLASSTGRVIPRIQKRSVEQVSRFYSIEDRPYVRLESEIYEQNVIQIAPTGTGKTTAYVGLADVPRKPKRKTRFQVIIVVPTYSQAVTLYREWSEKGFSYNYGIVAEGFPFKDAKRCKVIFTTYNSLPFIEPKDKMIVLLDEIHRLQTDNSYRKHHLQMATEHCDKMRKTGAIVHYATATLNDVIPVPADIIIRHEIPKEKPAIHIVTLTGRTYDAWLVDQVTFNAAHNTQSVVFYNNKNKLRSYHAAFRKHGLNVWTATRETRDETIDMTCDVILCTSILYDGHSLRTEFDRVRYYAPHKNKPAPCEFIQLINRVRDREEQTEAFIHFSSLGEYRWRMDTLTEATRIYRSAMQKATNRMTSIRSELLDSFRVRVLSIRGFLVSVDHDVDEYLQLVKRDVSFVGNFRLDAFSLYRSAIGRCSTTYQMELAKFGYASNTINVDFLALLNVDDIPADDLQILANRYIELIQSKYESPYFMSVLESSLTTFSDKLTKETGHECKHIGNALFRLFDGRLRDPFGCLLHVLAFDKPFEGRWYDKARKFITDHLYLTYDQSPHKYVFDAIEKERKLRFDDAPLVVDSDLWQVIRHAVLTSPVGKTQKAAYLSHYELYECDCQERPCSHTPKFNDKKWRRDVKNYWDIKRRKKARGSSERIYYIASPTLT